MNILIVGDVYSKLGRSALERNLKKIREEKTINLLIVNGENTSHGKGLNENHYKWYMNLGVSVLTLGNHSFQNKNVLTFIDDEKHLIRPLNYPEGTPGRGYVTLRYNDITITVFQLIGKTFMNDSENFACPFKTTEKLLEEVKSDLYICDFHAEATSEKVAYGLYFDGRVHIMVGTHTHVQTNDAHILPNGSMYMTDLGMTGALDGVIGVNPKFITAKFIEHTPARHEPYEEGKKQFSGLIVDINEKTKKVTKFEIVHMVE